MVIVSLSVDEQGQYLGTTHRVKHNMYERLTSHWASLVADGKITQVRGRHFGDNNHSWPVA